MNPDIEFSISSSALRKLHADADARRMSAGSLFRKKAWALAVDKSPQFDLSGEERTRTYHVALPEGNIRRLQHMAVRMGLPPDVIGEFVACYDWRDVGA